MGLLFRLMQLNNYFKLQNLVKTSNLKLIILVIQLITLTYSYYKLTVNNMQELYRAIGLIRLNSY